LYKLPKFKQTSNLTTSIPFIEYGTAYTFLTNESIEWQLSSLNINDTRSFPGKTLDVLYNENIGYMLYNDQADKVTLIKGHTKGVILFDNTSAVWISHSIPHFPPPKIAQKYYIQPSQCVYGQSMFCMSLELAELDNIGQQLLYNNPQVYDSFIPDYLKDLKVLENLVRVIKEDYSSVVAPWYNLNAFRTANGEELLSFAKFTYFGDDLYSGIVASYLQSNLLTETWNNGAGTLSSNCSIKFQVHNIEEVKFETIGIHFSVHSDHSKWAVTTGEKYRYNYLNIFKSKY
jgi:deoxyribonuclease II